MCLPVALWRGYLRIYSLSLYIETMLLNVYNTKYNLYYVYITKYGTKYNLYWVIN